MGLRSPNYQTSVNIGKVLIILQKDFHAEEHDITLGRVGLDLFG